MIVKHTTNAAEVIAWKKYRDSVKAANLVGIIPICNRPKPIYIFADATTEQINIEAFDRACDKMEAGYV